MSAPEPIPVRRPRRAGRRKLGALRAAAQVIAERGADSTRFSDVAEASGIPISTLQYYFGSREDLLVAAFRHASVEEIAGLRARTEILENPWERLVTVVDVALGGYRAAEPGAGLLWVESWRFAMHDPEMRADVLEDYNAWRSLISDAVRLGTDQGRFVPRSDPGAIAIAALGLIDGVGLPLALGDPAVPESVARTVVLAALAGLLGLPPLPA
jgi:AcrR family transcriptional regulator